MTHQTSLLNTRSTVAKRLWSGTSRPSHSMRSTPASEIMRGWGMSCLDAWKAVSIWRTLATPEVRTKIRGCTKFAPSNICQSGSDHSGCLCAAFPCSIGLEQDAQADCVGVEPFGESRREYTRFQLLSAVVRSVYGKIWQSDLSHATRRARGLPETCLWTMVRAKFKQAIASSVKSA